MKKKLFLLDMDGTIYLDETMFDGSMEFLNKIKDKGAKYVFLTNNSSKGVEDYIRKMDRLGLKTTADDFLTSVDCLIDYLKPYVDKKMYVLGTESLKSNLKNFGYMVSDDLDPDILILGFDRELTYKKLEDACYILSTKKDVMYLATNMDYVCPVSYGYVPDCGSIAIMIENATKRKPKFLGKPEPDMINMAVKKFGVTFDETILFGDRLYTDIKAGYMAGIDTCFVLSGEGTMDDLKDYDFSPTYIFNSVKDVIGRI